MILIKARAATYAELWFGEEPPLKPKADVLMFRQRPAPVSGNACSPFLTLVIDLSQDEDAIFAKFGNTNRYKIKRADKKDGLAFERYADPRPHLDRFCTFYNEFAQQKSLVLAYRRGLHAAADAGQLVLTTASRGGEPLVWHAYIMSGNRAALLHSASHFRAKDNDERALVGRANRWLHWRDMLELKTMGLSEFDWGGLFADESKPEQASINRFKYEFGERRETTYNCTYPITMRGRLAMLALSRIVKR